MPHLPGVYLFKGPGGEVLYVGKAKSLAQRTRSYLASDLAEPRLREMVDRAADIDAIVTETEVEALLLESSLVRQHRPHYNVCLKDDKSFPYVKVSVQEEFPRLSITRHVRSDGARYLGPYTDVKRLRRILREIRRVFPVRTCRNFDHYARADRPCLYFHIRRCVGPCYSRAHIGPAEYRSLVEGLLLYLTGRDAELLRRMRDEMDQASVARRFETAARRRDQIALLEKARIPQRMVARRGRDTDVLGLARQGRRAAVASLLVRGGRVVGKEVRILEGAGGLADGDVLRSVLHQHYLSQAQLPRRIVVGVEPAERALTEEALARKAGRPVEIASPVRGRGRRLVETAERNAALEIERLAARQAGRRARFAPAVVDLQRELGLAEPPYRMVCFDISNLGAENAVAAVVASENGAPRRGLYRRMRIRRPGPDDFAMMAEAVERWWTRVESGEMPRPDLVVIDGGVGQVSSARTVLDRVATRPVALLGLAKREEDIVRPGEPPLRLPRRSPALKALQRLRDEAHRFGLSYHRSLRTRARVASALDRVPGIGPARRAALLRAFGSVTAVRAAAAAEIARRARLPQALAERVAAHLALDAPAAAEPGFAPSPADAGHGTVLDRGPRSDGEAGSGPGSGSGGKG